MCHKVYSKLDASSIPEKEEMILCIMSFAGDEEDETVNIYAVNIRILVVEGIHKPLE